MYSLLIAWNVCVRAVRGKKEIWLLAILPVMMVVLMARMSGEPSVASLPIGLVNEDSGRMGTALIEYIDTTYDIQWVVLEIEEVPEAVEDQKVAMAFVIEPAFSQLIEAGTSTTLTIYTYQTDPVIESVKQMADRWMGAQYAVEQPNETYWEQLLSQRIEVQTGSIFDSGRQSRMTAVGFVLTFMMMLVFIVAGHATDDRKNHIMARLATFAVGKTQRMIGYWLGGTLLGFVQLIPIIIVLHIVFDLQTGMSTVLLSIVLTLFLFTTVAMGLFVAGLIRNRFNPMLLFAGLIVPTSLVGGAFIPLEQLPTAVGYIGYATPQRWAMEAISIVFDSGVHADLLWPMVVIAGFGVLFAAFGTRALRPM